MSIVVRVRFKPDRQLLQLYYVDPLTGADVTKSAKTTDWRAAERAAAAWQEQLALGKSKRGTSWDAFRIRFEDEHLASLSKLTDRSYNTALNAFERIIGHPRDLAAIDASVFSRFQSALREEEFPTTTIINYLQHVLSALSWASSMEMIDRVPKCVMPKVRKRKLMRGRPITAEEFERILGTVEKVLAKPHPNYIRRKGTKRPQGAAAAGRRRERMARLATQEAPRWIYFLKGLWLSGLRLGESLRLSWDALPMRVDLTGRRPRITVYAEGHKGGYDELIPMTPDFYALLLETPENERQGRVFKVPTKAADVGAQIREMSKLANVVVNEQGKNATAHDFRRSYGTRWATRVHPAVLQRMMRHKAIETTMKYYVDLDTDTIADKLWEAELYPQLYPQPAAKKTERAKSPRKTH